jgi:putative transposase
MPRRPRFVCPGVAHHITQRGNNREPVFLSSGHRRLYLHLLRQYAGRSALRILGYCLMPNHVHIVAIPEREDSLARVLGHAHSEYALALNRMESRTGHLWQNRFFSCPLDESHLFTAMRYIDLNPVRAGLAEEACKWPWSSALAHTSENTCDPVLDDAWAEHFGRWNYQEWHELLLSGMPDGESGKVRESTRTGAPLGQDEFVDRLESQAGRRLRVLPRGRPRLPAAATAQTNTSVPVLNASERNASVPFLGCF